ncbi:MAG TPA: 2-oxo-4-hydroxy-4-carboxy-5-ureidoimidazoline decarboxylase [Streptosporangiaceae bacterium]|jgi:2-oxo-4-hydroxy-4-carboxy-5-ureidoimidazoline decarboxylase|nr:2-oxo-4-hydroxy-4-carboxy-5-ureidoimidazoline decarboxylase [Streptosporangiaceae bacterium]
MTPPGSTSLLLTVFNTAAAGDAARDVTRCCAARPFTETIVAGRPYQDFDALDAAIDTGFAGLVWLDVVEALNDHPRIGDQSASGWSRAEQAGAAAAPADVTAAIADGNRAYEDAFGHVFLICATGLSGEQVLAALRYRLGNDPAEEHRIVTDELRKITKLRMRKLLGG